MIRLKRLLTILLIDEIAKENQFYANRGLPCPKDSLDSREKKPQPQLIKPNSNEQIGVVLRSNSDKIKQIKQNFIRCSNQATILHLKKFISLCLYQTQDRHAEVFKCFSCFCLFSIKLSFRLI